ncbi:hypothetical protein IEU95_14915 [Hoyosella rhizosphaerae]|uniref:Ribosomally synthesized peptide with SipW-like signal peptide n=1 Tax=Hoyosella rhizosphaerae TaxID=1755582 RepID=A0A916UHA3_9ACTN|nr:hypothetical protein [Hoyosella rhizosphaerae]MBN4928129.1 hypothetical protein [Hoyosella rhizosphaerae]GGC72587.1 hypothetical protein GCM10011410_27100 [Hoyosella rhizosphaerae]
MTSHVTPLRPRRTKFRALAAAGLVLGTGTTIVLASWTDSSFVTGIFALGSFGIEASVNGANSWYDDEDDLIFTVNPTTVRPGDTHYAPIALRTKADSMAALVTLNGAINDGDAAVFNALRYRVVESTTCNSSAFTGASTYVVGSNTTASALATGSAPDAIALPAAASLPGAAKTYCFEIALPDTSANWTNANLPNKTAAARWKFTAQSGS